MPVEPNTGITLPNKGEPGYDQAKANFPDLYAAEEQGMAPDAAPPQGMPGDEGPQDAAMPQDPMMDMAQSAPMPEKPYSVSAVKTLLKELNKTLDKFAGQDMPDLDPEMNTKGAKLEGVLPAEIFVTLMALDETLKMMGSEFSDKYNFNAEDLLTDADLRKMTAILKKMSKDKKLIEAMQMPAGGMEPEPTEQPSAPGFFSEDEQTLAANMG